MNYLLNQFMVDYLHLETNYKILFKIKFYQSAKDIVSVSFIVSGEK